MKQSPAERQLIDAWISGREVPRHKPGVSGVPVATRCQWRTGCRLPASRYRTCDGQRIAVCQGHSHRPLSP